MRDWSTMPPELLSLISQYLTTASDFIRFRSVCPCWRSAASHCALPPSLPCIAIPSSDDDDTDCKFTSLYDGTVHYRQSFPNYYHHKQFFGAAAGWVAVRRKDPFYSSISLLNPVTDAEIHLPPLEEAYRNDNTDLFFIQKITLSSPINDAAVSTVAIFCSNQPLKWKMALARPGAVAWTPVDSTSFRYSIDYHDAIFFCERFYVVDGDGRLYAFEDDLYPRLVLVVKEWPDLNIPTRNRRKRCYLAESAVELLMVERYFRRTGRNIVNKTKRFEVWREDPNRDNSWRDS